MMKSTCKTCIFWGGRTIHKFENKPFGVYNCESPELAYLVRPDSSNGATLVDEDHFNATLYTGEDFGCVNHHKE
jgi:hypothetical protein